MSKDASRSSGRRKRTPRGAHLKVHNNRDRNDADQALEKRLREERREEALAEARREQERLERRIAREKITPTMGPTLGALYVAEAEAEPEPEPVLEIVLEPELEPVHIAPEAPTPVAPVDTPALALLFPDLPWEGDGESRAIGQARTLLRQGYNIRRVVRQSGVGLKWLDDIPIDEAGFGLQG